MGKQANLLYKASRDGSSSKVFWKKCLGQKETIVLVKTDLNSVIGGYCPDQWEDTTHKKVSLSVIGWKNVVSGKPFLFYFLEGQIQMIKHRDDEIPFMGSDKDYLIGFGNGLWIRADQNKLSEAGARNDLWVHP